MSSEDALFTEILASLPGVAQFDPSVATTGGLASVFPVSELATAALGSAALAAAAYAGAAHVTVDHRLASAWFATSIRPVGWTLAPAWDAIAGDYRTRDGWVRLHTNAPHHRAAALAVLNTDRIGAATAPKQSECADIGPSARLQSPVRTHPNRLKASDASPTALIHPKRRAGRSPPDGHVSGRTLLNRSLIRSGFHRPEPCSKTVGGRS